MSDRVSVHIENGIADVRLNRPEKMNAIDPAMFEGLCDTGRALAGEKSVRAVVLSGEGRAFCAGLDFASMKSSLERQIEIIPGPEFEKYMGAVTAEFVPTH